MEIIGEPMKYEYSQKTCLKMKIDLLDRWLNGAGAFLY